MNWLKQLFGTDSTRRVTVDNPLIIESPRIAFLNLIGPTAEALMKHDKDALGSFFASAAESAGGDTPLCDVLMIYCDLQNSGAIVGCSNGLRDIIDASTAAIVIVASENNADGYITAGKRTGHAKANLVMTLNRKGPAFTAFFAGLFGKMFAGKSMPLAWVELAPQITGATHDNCPETISLLRSVIFFSTAHNKALQLTAQ